jgi:hypothetical protein
MPAAPVPAAAQPHARQQDVGLVDQLKRGEALAVVLVAAGVLFLSTFLPWAKLSLNNGQADGISDSQNAWASDVPWLIRGFDAEEFRLALVQGTAAPTGGTDLIIILPLLIGAVALAWTIRRGKTMAYASEGLAVCCGLLVIVLALEIAHLGSWAGDLQDQIIQNEGTATVDGGAGLGLWLAALAGAAMTYGAIRSLLSSRSR